MCSRPVRARYISHSTGVMVFLITGVNKPVCSALHPSLCCREVSKEVSLNVIYKTTLRLLKVDTFHLKIFCVQFVKCFLCRWCFRLLGTTALVSSSPHTKHKRNITGRHQEKTHSTWDVLQHCFQLSFFFFFAFLWPSSLLRSTTRSDRTVLIV